MVRLVLMWDSCCEKNIQIISKFITTIFITRVKVKEKDKEQKKEKQQQEVQDHISYTKLVSYYVFNNVSYEAMNKSKKYKPRKT